MIPGLVWTLEPHMNFYLYAVDYLTSLFIDSILHALYTFTGLVYTYVIPFPGDIVFYYRFDLNFIIVAVYSNCMSLSME